MATTPVLAQSRHAFDQFVKKHNLTPSHFRFLKDYQDLHGFRGTVLTYGRWWDNKSYNADFHRRLEALAMEGSISVIKNLED